ncbi:hypothetical protein OO006_08135 [Prosthecochloris sp. SCSIO W1101]|uniref:ATP-grasp domain-containing protein n=1 Tax=Prosthecochloris sp. SCSIO W1101 TaxID=2992242 RepID=UPI00223D26C3|nr:hypothetical protein [Prosthecochloris sp. SCSIO W1101]UZJ40339.1 hypothetical protein OO006_08135 [Prosthecochloris sp. SCSIO W1101]
MPGYNSLFLSRIAASSKRLGAGFTFYDKLNGRIGVVERGGCRAFFGAGPLKLWPFNSSLWMSVVDDKELTIRILAENGIRVPKTFIAFTGGTDPSDRGKKSSSLEQVLPEISYPVVVKPNRGRSAAGLSFLYDSSNVSEAVAYAKEYDNGVLFQEMVQGAEYRVLVLDGRPVVLIERETRKMTGDGVRNVSRLAAGSGESDGRVLGRGEMISFKSYIAKYGDKVFDDDLLLAVHPVSNLSIGGKVIDCQVEISEEWKRLCRAIYKSVPLRFFALDCKGHPGSPKRLFVLEINANPGIESVYRWSEATGDMIVDLLVENALVNPE